ncbi:MAG: hypothetical protein K6A73_02100, partial [Bacteroidales bacterium]|nr:hypothetical protein [Bacteroidales bacterium]
NGHELIQVGQIMDINDLFNIINLENNDSEIIAMSMVVKDSNSGELTTYFVNCYGGLDSYNIGE